MTITEFLLARFAEDETIARGATGGDRTGNWWIDPDEGGVADVSCLDVQGFITAVDSDAGHITRHDPARVLAECEAKRRIVQWCGERARIWVGTMGDDPEHPRAEHFVEGSPVRPADWVALRHLAAVYADHPDYDSDWAA